MDQQINLHDMESEPSQSYVHRVENDIFFERVHGQVCLDETLYLSTYVQKTLHATPLRYRVVDFLDSEIASIEQKLIDRMLSTKLLSCSGQKLKLLLIIKDDDDLIQHVTENIKSFSSDCLILVFGSRREVDNFIKTDQVFPMTEPI